MKNQVYMIMTDEHVDMKQRMISEGRGEGVEVKGGKEGD